MMTWLPYPNARLSVHVLDSMRLGEQAGQAISILRYIAGKEGGKKAEHRIVKAWKEFPEFLVLYLEYVILEIYLRGQDTGLPLPRSKGAMKAYGLPTEWIVEEPRVPDWIGAERIHASHRGTLMSMDRTWYSQFAWMETPVRRLEWPGIMPSAGQHIMNEKTGEVCMVHSFDASRRPMLIFADGIRPIERAEVYKGQWRRVIVAD